MELGADTAKRATGLEKQFGRYPLLRRKPEGARLLIAWLVAGPFNPWLLLTVGGLSYSAGSWMILPSASLLSGICAGIAILLLRRQETILMVDLQFLGLALPFAAGALVALATAVLLPDLGGFVGVIFIPLAFVIGVPAGLTGALAARFIAFRSAEAGLSPAPPAMP